LRRAAALAAASVAAVLIQMTLLNRLPLPGGAAPDLVLILVVAVALTGGPMEGMLTGFFAGLALDVSLPASPLVGQYALVFCLTGYTCGQLKDTLERANWLPLGAVALGAAGGEGLYTATGMLFGEPGVTWSAVRQVLPASVGYDLLVCPFVLYAVVSVRGKQPSRFLAGGALDRKPGAALAGTGGAVRDTRTGRGPRLRAATVRHGDGWIGSASQRAGRAAAQVLATRPVHLRLRGGQAGSALGPAAAKTLPARPVHLRFGHGRNGSPSAQGAKARPTRPVNLRLGGARRRDGTVGGSVLGSRMPGRKAPRGRMPRGSALRGSGSGGSVLSRAGGSLRSGLRSGSGKGAEPRFRRQQTRGFGSGPIPRRGRLAGGGLRRRGRGRARFGRRSTVWRIGSKRTGGLS
jgi:rod shape-determining protein MreD